MDGLCIEVLQIILNELDDPTSFSLLSRQYYTFTQDPYVRSSYFLSRYGPIQALYWAFGRGRLMNEQVIDTLLSSGAHLSRYLVQCAMHHFYRTAQVPFIKTPWVRSMNLQTFTHFQLAAVRLYGNIPLGKGDDDAALFDTVIKESRFPIEQRSTRLELLKEVLEKYKFIPFCNKDAMMANFPLALSIEPTLLPYARANGFHMDHKYRDFVFRKMFEKPAIPFEARADEIVRNVQELTRLDNRMFLSRTVAAEICLEVKSNEAAYNALKRLDKEGMLRFELSSVVISLIKTYANTRSITHANSFSALRQLYADFPTNDPVVRQVLLLQVFLSHCPNPITAFPILSTLSDKQYVQSCKETIERIGLAPVKRTDLLEVLSNSFAPDRFNGIIEYGRAVLDMSRIEIEALVQDVAFRCLENGCKGRMLSQLKESYPFLVDPIRERVLGKYKLNLDDLPSWQDEDACNAFEAPLARDHMLPPRRYVVEIGATASLRQPAAEVVAQPPKGAMPTSQDSTGDTSVDSASDRMDIDIETRAVKQDSPQMDDEDLGAIGQDTLSTMIRKDELTPARGRRRHFDPYASYHESQGKLSYPLDVTPVGKWIHATYGPQSAVTAVFMLHGVINGSPSIVQPYLGPEPFIASTRVPVTLKHFKTLACLGRTPASLLFDEIESGAEFYFSEEDYLSPEELNGLPPHDIKKRKRSRTRIKTVTEYSIKIESSTPLSDEPIAGPSSVSLECYHRPRREALLTKSYIIPDSDDEMIVDEDEGDIMQEVHTIAKKRKAESNLQKWIKHLTPLLKEEQRKYKERKRNVLASVDPSTKVKVPKNEFHRVLAIQLSRLRKVDKEKRKQLYGADCPDHDYSSGEEDEYHARPAKRRNIEA